MTPTILDSLPLPTRVSLPRLGATAVVLRLRGRGHLPAWLRRCISEVIR